MGSTSVGSVLDEEQGIIPRAIRHIFDEIQSRTRKNPGSKCKAMVSFIEIVSCKPLSHPLLLPAPISSPPVCPPSFFRASCVRVAKTLAP